MGAPEGAAFGHNFYPRSPCGERQLSSSFFDIDYYISIHALLAESDAIYPSSTPPKKYFYPRSPCGERLRTNNHIRIRERFLSTLSLRRATAPPNNLMIQQQNFYPRSPCGERRRFRAVHNTEIDISIHALLAESDHCRSEDVSYSITNFYPRSPCGERPVNVSASGSTKPISIHALLAESDNTRSQPRRPKRLFLSTLSLRRATAKVHKTVGHFCAYGTNFMGIASSC